PGADVDADLRGERFHLHFVADQGRLDETLGCCLNSAAQSYVRHGPADGGCDRWQGLAALEELVKNVVVSRMTYQRVDGHCFGERGEIAHRCVSSMAGAG